VFDVEIGDDAVMAVCDCCGKTSYNGHGFVYKNRDAYAVYFAGWSPGHRERGVSMAIAVGRWDDSSTSLDRVCVGVEAYEGESQILFRYVDPDESPWPQTELLGDMIPRERALRSEIGGEVLLIAEQVVRLHPAIRRFLQVS
jgi:hypothetical protein